MQSTDTTDATSARHRRCHISAAFRGSYNVSLHPSSVLTTSACTHHQFLQRQPVPSSVLTTSACAHHQFLQRQPVPIISSYNVSLCPSSVPSTSEYFLLIAFERECSYIKVNKADLWRLSQAAVLFRFWFFFLVCCSGSVHCQWRLSRKL